MHAACARATQPTREYVRPDNQLALSEADLAEEIPRMLTANNPMAPKNLARCAGAGGGVVMTGGLQVGW
jgi:hypothetical protein